MREDPARDVPGDTNAAATAASDATDADTDTDMDTNTEAPPLVAAYRHDVHKLRGRSHAAAADTAAGVRVNEAVPLGADRDAARLSRPEGDPTQTVPAHNSPYRLSLLTGETIRSTTRDDDGDDGDDDGDGDGTTGTNGNLTAAAAPLVAPTDAARLHAAWLTSRVAATYSESLYVPYTSLKYHTLLVAALLAAYRAGHDFDELYLAATPGGADPDGGASGDATGPAAAGWTAGHEPAAGQRLAAALSADVVVPHETVLWTPPIALHVTPEPGDRPAVRLGTRPRRAFGRIWARLPTQTLAVNGERRWRLLDAQLRRLRAWSTALQYIEDFVAGRGAAPGWGGARP